MAESRSAGLRRVAFSHRQIGLLEARFQAHHGQRGLEHHRLAAHLTQLLHGALVLQEQVLAVRSRTLPDDDPALQRARGNLAATKSGLGDLQEISQGHRLREPC